MQSRDGKYSTARTRYGSYAVRFYCEDGIRYEKKVKKKTERDALIRTIKRRESLDYWYPNKKSTTSSPITGTFNSLADDWLHHGEFVREVSKSCLINYRGHLSNHIRESLGKKPLQELSLTHIEQLAADLKKKKPQSSSYVSVRKNRMAEDDFFDEDEYLSTSYRREILTVACMITKYGSERQLIPDNPFSDFKLPSTPDQPYDYWRIEEEDKFLLWLEEGGVFYKWVARPGSVKRGNPEMYQRKFKMRPGKAQELYDVVLFALRSGLRKGEIGALRPCDVNFDENFIVVRRAWSEREGIVKKTTKSKSYRRIEMNEDMRNIIRKRMIPLKSDQELLFDVRTWAIKNFSKYCVKAGVREIHFHSLRHTCLTNLANGYGMSKPLPLPQVQQIAGHRDISTTMRYVHTNGIKGTASLQWSRAERKSQLDKGNSGMAQVESSKIGQSPFRVIAGGVN